MKQLTPPRTQKVQINWSKPMDQQDLPEVNDSYWYRIIGISRKGNVKMFYIGKTERSASKRVKEHEGKLKYFKRTYPRHDIQISVGVLQNKYKGRKKSKFINDVESVLIYAHADNPNLKNKMNIWTHGIARELIISNKGYLEGGVFKEIFLGVTYKM